jgi:hypothetical protein
MNFIFKNKPQTQSSAIIIFGQTNFNFDRSIGEQTEFAIICTAPGAH